MSQVLNTVLLTPDASQWPRSDYPVKNNVFNCAEWFKSVDSVVRAVSNVLKVFQLQTLQAKGKCIDLSYEGSRLSRRRQASFGPSQDRAVK